MKFEYCEVCGRTVAVQSVASPKEGRSMYRVGVCEGCGRRGRRIAKHHLIPRDRGGTNDPENLMDLCDSCHNYVEIAEPLPTTRERVLAAIAAREAGLPAIRFVEPRLALSPQRADAVSFPSMPGKQPRGQGTLLTWAGVLSLLSLAERNRLESSFPTIPQVGTVTEVARCLHCQKAIFYAQGPGLWFHASFLLGLMASSNHSIRPLGGTRGRLPQGQGAPQNARLAPERAKTGGEDVRATFGTGSASAGGIS